MRRRLFPACRDRRAGAGRCRWPWRPAWPMRAPAAGRPRQPRQPDLVGAAGHRHRALFCAADAAQHDAEQPRRYGSGYNGGYNRGFARVHVGGLMGGLLGSGLAGLLFGHGFGGFGMFGGCPRPADPHRHRRVAGALADAAVPRPVAGRSPAAAPRCSRRNGVPRDAMRRRDGRGRADAGGGRRGRDRRSPSRRPTTRRSSSCCRRSRPPGARTT